MNRATAVAERYGELLAQTRPAAIHGETEYRNRLRLVRELMEKPDGEITPAEGRLIELLGILIEEYEDRVHPLPKGAPQKMLAHLLSEKGMKPSDLWSILPKSRVSEILSGKRGISKTQAKQLARLLHVPVELFL